MRNPHTILNLPKLIGSLDPEGRMRFERLFRVSEAVGELSVPESMYGWVEERFRSVAAVERQRIVKVTNLVTLEGALFNEIRSSRPFEVCDDDDVRKLILASKGGPFCTPLTATPEDPFGRVQGRHCITASNIAKYDGFHGLVIFNEHDPLVWSEEAIADYFGTALEWAERAHEIDQEAVYFFLMWNCLWKSGASIIHGHTQMTLSHDIHYAKVEAWRRAALAYRSQHGVDLFDDLWKAHDSLELAWERDGVRGLAYLAPIKEKEVLLFGERLDGTMASCLYRVIRAMVEDMGVRAFNLAVYMPPMAPVEEDWRHFPVMVRIVDRGDVTTRVADFGAMELYASSVVASDPFAVASVLRERLREQDRAPLPVG
mgnify:CR=1 FL=1